jgi:hypothetical protein
MSDRWEVLIRPADDYDGPAPFVPFGPGGEALPERFTAFVADYREPLTVELAAAFDGLGPVTLDVVAVHRNDGLSVTPANVARLQIARAVHTAALHAMTFGPGLRYVAGRYRAKRVAGGPPAGDDLLLLARIYWAEYVSWGQPRQAVMAAFGVPRTTANRWIKRAAAEYRLPGPHSGEGE